MTKQHSCAHSYSIIAPVYNLEHYLDDFLASLEAQSVNLSSAVEIIFVDDGSHDSSADIIARRQASLPNVRYFHKENEGRASARNLGLRHATGEWVTFMDPDDFLDKRYFEEVDKFLRLPQSRDAGMVCCRRLYYSDRVGNTLDLHYLRGQFTKGTRWIPASDCGDFMEASNSSVFYKRELLLRRNIRNKEDIRPYFEDTEMNIFYLQALGDMLIGILPAAVYYYRIRAEVMSFMNSMRQFPEFYDVLFDKGYIRTLRTLQETQGRIPEYAQRLVISSLSAQVAALTSAAGYACLRRFTTTEALRRRIRDTIALLDPELLLAAGGPQFVWLMRELTGDARLPKDQLWITVHKFDPRARQLKITYPPASGAAFYQGQTRLAVAHGKKRTRVILGETIAAENILWLQLNDAESPLRAEHAGLSVHFMFQGRDWGAELPLPEALALLSPPERKADTASLFPSVEAPERFQACWLFMDSAMQADDNAEHLYWHVAQHHPELRAFFVLAPQSPHWERLRRQGAALLAFGSEEHQCALAQCEYLISSDFSCKNEAAALLAARGLPPASFIFLQHGYIKDDMSEPFQQEVDLFLTGATGEYKAIAHDGPYIHTSKETVLTGFPRTDALLGNATPHERVVMVMPTWRSYLPAHLGAESDFSREQRNAVTRSAWFRAWNGFFHAPETKSLLHRYGWRILFWPHKMFQAHLPLFSLPDYVTTPDFRDAPRIHRAFYQAGVFVTDYTSAAFDFALLRRRVIYWQFDLDEFFQQTHNQAAPGWFDYGRDGFGPVARTEAQLYAALEDALLGDGVMEKKYRERVDAAIPFQDTRNCQRVFNAIRELQGGVEQARGERI